MAAASAEGGMNLLVAVVEIQRVLHFVAIMKILAVGLDGRDFNLAR